jgi:hypothetical protein
MCPVDLIGYLACALVFATFYMTAMLPLRLTAIASNVAFIAYGYLGGMTPILLLHMSLLPLNVWRLCETMRLANRVLRPADETWRSSQRFPCRRKASSRPAGGSCRRSS